jgi:hypothetical protein
MDDFAQASSEFAKSLQEFDQLIGEAHNFAALLSGQQVGGQQPQQQQPSGGEHGQTQPVTSEAPTGGTPAEGAPSAQAAESPEGTKTPESAKAAESAPSASSEIDEILKAISGVIEGEPAAEEKRIPLEVFRDPEALERFARENPELGASIVRFLFNVQRALLASQQQQQAQAQIPTGQPQQQPQQQMSTSGIPDLQNLQGLQAPQADQAYMQQLQQTKSLLEREISSLVELLKAPPQQPSPPPQPQQPSEERSFAEDVFARLFGEEQPTPQQAATDHQQQVLADQLNRLQTLLRLNLFTQLLDRVNDEISRREFLQRMQGANLVKTLQGFASEIQNVSQEVTKTLDEISARVNRQYGIPDDVGEVIAKAVRDELINRGVDVRKVIGRIALEQDPEMRKQLMRGFVQEVASMYGRYASGFVKNMKRGAAQAEQKPASLPVAPPPEQKPQPQQPSAGANSGRPFADVEQEYARALQQALEYAENLLPHPLSGLKI